MTNNTQHVRRAGPRAPVHAPLQRLSNAGALTSLAVDLTHDSMRRLLHHLELLCVRHAPPRLLVHPELEVPQPRGDVPRCCGLPSDDNCAVSLRQS
eukprot:4102226-Pyramimonas_sp.AAC.1